MDKRQAVIAEARQWIGTPYHHQQMVKGVGCDCVGLIRGVGFATGVMPEQPEVWARFNAYGRRPNPRRMLEGMNTFLAPVKPGDEQDGDIAWLEWRSDLPMHLALIAEGPLGEMQLIHSFSDARAVVCHGVTTQWLDRIVSYWRYPGLAA